MSARGRTAAALAVAACAWLAAAGGASGHSAVVATAPADGAVLDRAPRAVRVTHSSPLGAPGTAAAEGAELSGPPRLDPRDASILVIPLRPGPAGVVEVSWVPRGADGHELPGSVSYRVRGGAGWGEVVELGAAMVAAARRVTAATGSPGG